MSKRKQWKRISSGLSAVAIAAHPLLIVSAGGVGSLVSVTAVQAAALMNWRFDPGDRRLEFTVPQGTTPRYFLVAQPARIVVDLPNTEIGAVPEQQSFPGAVRQIRVAQFQPGLVRIVVELAPNAVLAPEQVEMQRVSSGGGGGGDRWVLRPLLVDADNMTATQPRPTPPATSTPAALPPTPATTTATPPTTPVAPPSIPAATDTPPTPVPPASASGVAGNLESPGAASSGTPTTATDLPPLEPGGREIPVQLPPSVPSQRTTAIAPRNSPAPIEPPASPGSDAAGVVVTPSLPTPAPAPSAPLPGAAEITVAPPTPTPSLTPSAPAATVAVPSSEPTAADTPTPTAPTGAVPPEATLPPAVAMGSQPVTVSVPPPTNREVAQPTLPENFPAPSNGQPNIVTVPAPPSLTLPPPEATMSNGPSQRTPGRVAVAPRRANVLIPSGTILRLRYPRSTVLNLPADQPWQEVLLLDQPVLDERGNVIIPEGSQVVGRFETGSGGSRFIAQAIAIDGRNVLIEAQSQHLGGDRQVSRDNLIRNSAIGAVGMTLLGLLTGGIGLLGIAAGAAGGAASAYLTAPQPAVIQPNQIVEVRLMKDIPRS